MSIENNKQELDLYFAYLFYSTFNPFITFYKCIDQ